METNKAGRPQDDAQADGVLPATGRQFLLAIAIDAYEHCPRLYNCEKDAQDLIEVLSSRYQFEEQHIKRLFTAEATRERIHDTFRELARAITPDDNLLIYFSGHGELDDVFDEGYWIPVEARRDKHDQFIPNSWILKALRAIKSRHTFLIADSCFSGSLFMSKGLEKNINQRSEADPSRWGLTAGRKEVVSDGKPGDNSPFAAALLYRLRNSDKSLGVQELCAYVVEQVKAATAGRQEPIGEPLQVEGHKSGQFYFRPQTSEDDHWQAALLQNTITAYRQYRRQYSQGRYRAEAIDRIEKIEEQETKAWQETKAKDSVSAYERFLEKYPNSAHVQEAESRIDALLNKKTPAPSLPQKPATPPTVTPKPADGLVLIPGGTFEMGDVMGDNEFENEKPVHSVTLSDFYLGVHAVTFEDYDRFCEATGREKPEDEDWGRSMRPVINVNWYDAVTYCNWLSQQLGFDPVYKIKGEEVSCDWTQNGYRLPTEAEWEYAARALNGKGGGKVRFGNGKDIADPKEINFNGSKEYKAPYSIAGEYTEKTTSVHVFSPNSLALYEMSGNVYEWCWDWWGARPPTPQSDPKGSDNPDSGAYRVIRGGSWRNEAAGVRVAYRSDCDPGYRLDDLGFRIARAAL